MTSASNAWATMPATLHYFQSPPTEAVARVRRYDAGARAWRAWLALLGGWGLAICAVFIPVLHFVLVPGLLLAAPLVAWARWKEDVTLLGAEGPCPACGAAQTFSEHGNLKPEQAVRCEACRRMLVLCIAPIATDAEAGI